MSRPNRTAGGLTPDASEQPRTDTLERVFGREAVIAMTVLVFLVFLCPSFLPRRNARTPGPQAPRTESRPPVGGSCRRAARSGPRVPGRCWILALIHATRCGLLPVPGAPITGTRSVPSPQSPSTRCSNRSSWVASTPWSGARPASGTGRRRIRGGSWTARRTARSWSATS